MDWHKERFDFSDTKFRFDCVCCSRSMYFPKSKLGKYKTCSKECKSKLQLENKLKRRRQCVTCGKIFEPRQQQIDAGIGLYCSRKCSSLVRVKASATKEAIEKRLKTYKQNVLLKKIIHPTGENHPRWKGGPKANRQRRQESGKALESLKKYRKENPHKVREFALNRKKRKYGRLPKGSILKIGSYQQWRCAICKKSIKNKYHVDHILPLAKGGKHEYENIQLTCPQCNVRKSAKDPIDYMQSLGFLL